MRNIIKILMFLISVVIYAQVQPVNYYQQLNKVNKANENDSIQVLVRTVGNPDHNIVKYVSASDIGGVGDGIQSIVAGDNISIDNTDPQNPVVSSTGEIQDLQSVLNKGNEVLNSSIFMNVDADAFESSNNIFPFAVSVDKAITKGGQVAIQVDNDGKIRFVGSVGSNTSNATHNTVYGGFALHSLTRQSVTDGSNYNSAFGSSALRELITGSRNTALGSYAGLALTTGSRNIFIGSHAGYSVANLTGVTWIGNYRGMIADEGMVNSIIISDGRDATNKSGVGFMVTADGTTTVPRQTINTIDADTTGKAVITKEWFEANSGGTTPTLEEVLTEGNTTTLDLTTTGEITANMVTTRSIDMKDGYSFIKTTNGYIEDEGGTLILDHDYGIRLETPVINLSAPELYLNNQTFPSTAGTNGQVLTTDGSNMSWEDVVVEEQQFVQITENGNTGWGLKYRKDNPDYYGDIGENAVDLGYSDSNSTTIGATGYNSTVSGGFSNTASGESSTVSGGAYNTANSYGEWVGGIYGTIPTGQSATSWVGTDRLFNVGNGINSSARSDAFTILKNGLATLPSVYNELIDEEPTGKAVVTKEWVEYAIKDLEIPEPIWTWDAVNGNMSVLGSSGTNNTGQSTFFVGNGAGENNSAYGTVGIGYQTVQNQAKTYNIGIGTQSGQNYSGANAVLIGYQAGQNSEAFNLVAIGLEAAKGFTGTNSGSVVAIGRQALATPTTEGFSLWQGSDIVAIGTDAAKNVASSYRDVYIGHQAGRDAGVAATANNQYSGNNVGIGLSALRGVVGTDNIGIGGSWTNNDGGTPLGAGRNLKGNGNILLGAYTGHSAVGNGNIIMGDRAQGVINGSRNVILQGIGTITGFDHNKNTVINAQWHTGSYIGAFDPHAQSKNELTAIGWNYAIYGNGTTRKLSIYPTASINPAEPRERLDLTDGFMVSAGTKVDQGSYQITLEANTLTANRSQKYPDADGTFALIEESGKRIVIDLEEFTLPAAISAGIQNSFAPINILTICPSVDLNYIDWEITWKESGVMHKISALDDFSIQLKWSSEDCFQLTGLTKAESGVSVNKGNSPKLILRY